MEPANLGLSPNNSGEAKLNTSKGSEDYNGPSLNGGKMNGGRGRLNSTNGSPDAGEGDAGTFLQSSIKAETRGSAPF